MASTGYSSCKSAVIGKHRNPAGRKTKAESERLKKIEEIEKAKIHEIMKKPVTTKTMYDYMNVKKRINYV